MSIHKILKIVPFGKTKSLNAVHSPITSSILNSQPKHTTTPFGQTIICKDRNHSSNFKKKSWINISGLTLAVMTYGNPWKISCMNQFPLVQNHDRVNKQMHQKNIFTGHKSIKEHSPHVLNSYNNDHKLRHSSI